MGTKNNPAEFDCYANALPDEPMFILLARDPSAPGLVEDWASIRNKECHEGRRPMSDQAMVREALECAAKMVEWRKANDGAWRKPRAFIKTGGET